MKSLVYILSCLCTLLGWIACSEDELENKESDKGIIVELTTGSFDTKSHLYSQGNWHHVEKVYAILYYCGPTTQMTPDPATTRVVTSQLLQKNGAVWNPSKAPGYGEGQAQTENFELTLPQENLTLVPGKYMILCVGVDEASGATFGLDFIASTLTTPVTMPAFAKPGATLTEAQAVLQKNSQTEPYPYENDPTGIPGSNLQDKDLIRYGQPDIAHSEFFAGWQSFDFMPDDLNVVRIEMRRRVAGVLCYLSDIPYKINEQNSAYRVTKVRLNLCGAQNTQISLLRKAPTTPGQRSDFGSQPKASKVICEFDLTDLKPLNDQMTLYRIPTAHLTGRQQLENTLLMGAYLLPMNASEATTLPPTFEIELLGYPFDDSASDHIVAGSTITSVKRFPALYDGLSQTHFPIHPNMIYHIGQKMDDVTTEGDFPESLAGTKVTVREEPWHEVGVDVEFPSVPVTPSMRIICSRGEYRVKPKTAGGDYYIFDCIGADTNTLVVNPSILYNRWRVRSIAPAGENDRMIYFKQLDGTYTDSYTGEGTLEIPIVITDYAQVNGVPIRTVQLELTSLNDLGAEQLESRAIFPVQQYNAIIVNMPSNGGGYRGFSRFDYGTERSISTGKIISPGIPIQWGYFNSAPTQIYGHGINASSRNDGQINYMVAKNRDAAGAFINSAIEQCGQYGFKMSVSAAHVYTLNKEQATWYLPSRDELNQFLQGAEVPNIDSNQFYWSSYAVPASNSRTYVYKKDGSVREEKKGRNNYFLARQACHATN